MLNSSLRVASEAPVERCQRTKAETARSFICAPSLLGWRLTSRGDGCKCENRRISGVFPMRMYPTTLLVLRTGSLRTSVSVVPKVGAIVPRMRRLSAGLDCTPLIDLHIEPHRQTCPHLLPCSPYRIAKLRMTPAAHKKPSVRPRSLRSQHIRTFRYREQKIRIPVAQQTVYVSQQIEHHALECHPTVLRSCAGVTRLSAFQFLDDECGQKPASYLASSECTE